MPEEQAFAVLIKIMYQYHHRDVFKTNFYQLHLMFYQLDRLLKVATSLLLSSSQLLMLHMCTSKDIVQYLVTSTIGNVYNSIIVCIDTQTAPDVRKLRCLHSHRPHD